MREIICEPNEAKNGFKFSDYNKAKMLDWLKEFRYFRIRPVERESRKQRGFYHGAVCALYAYFHENLDHHNPDDIEIVHEWLKIEYNGDYVSIGGKSHRVGKSTKGELNEGYLERCIEGLHDQYTLDPEVLNTKRYKNWRDTIFPSGGPANYLDYLESIKLLKK